MHFDEGKKLTGKPKPQETNLEKNPENKDTYGGDHLLLLRELQKLNSKQLDIQRMDTQRIQSIIKEAIKFLNFNFPGEEEGIEEVNEVWQELYRLLENTLKNTKYLALALSGLTHASYLVPLWELWCKEFEKKKFLGIENLDLAALYKICYHCPSAEKQILSALLAILDELKTSSSLHNSSDSSRNFSESLSNSSLEYPLYILPFLLEKLPKEQQQDFWQKYGSYFLLLLSSLLRKSNLSLLRKSNFLADVILSLEPELAFEITRQIWQLFSKELWQVGCINNDDNKNNKDNYNNYNTNENNNYFLLHLNLLAIIFIYHPNILGQLPTEKQELFWLSLAEQSYFLVKYFLKENFEAKLAALLKCAPQEFWFIKINNFLYNLDFWIFLVEKLSASFESQINQLQQVLILRCSSALTNRRSLQESGSSVRFDEKKLESLICLLVKSLNIFKLFLNLIDDKTPHPLVCIILNALYKAIKKVKPDEKTLAKFRKVYQRNQMKSSS